MKLLSSKNLLIFVLLFFACNSQESQSIINVYTGDVSVVENNALIAGTYQNTIIDIDYSGNIQSRSQDITNHGHCWSTDSLPSLSDNLLSYGPINEADTFYTEISNLQYNTTYFARAFIIAENTIHYGNTVKFNIEEIEQEEPEEPEIPEEPEEPEDTKSLWTEQSKFEGSQYNFSQGFVIGNYLFAGLSSRNNRNENTRFWRYNTNNDSWREIADFEGTPVNDAVLLSYNQKGYLIGGNRLNNSELPTDQFYEYDAEDDEWDKLEDFKGRPRRFATGFRWQNYIIYGLGEKRDDLWAYNIDDDEWNKLKVDIPGKLKDRELAISFSYSNKVFIGFGKKGNYKNDLWSFEPNKDNWEQLEDFPGTGRVIQCLFVINDAAYFISGYDENGKMAENWKYNINSNTWEKIEDDFELLNKVAFGLAINNKGYAIFDSEKSFWSFDPNLD